MPKYLVEATYTGEGAKGVLKSGGSARLKAVKELTAKVKGTVEAFYFTFGERDAVIVLDLPDDVTAAGIALAVKATGAIHTKTTVLLTPEEIDDAAKMHVEFHAPGT